MREEETIFLGGTEFRLYPVRGGETRDALVSTTARDHRSACSVRLNAAAAGPGGAWTTGRCIQQALGELADTRAERHRLAHDAVRCTHGEGSALRRVVVRIGRAAQEWLNGTPSLTSVA